MHAKRQRSHLETIFLEALAFYSGYRPLFMGGKIRVMALAYKSGTNR